MAIYVDVPRGIDRITTEVQRHLRIVFFGTPKFAVPALRLLVQRGWPIAMVVTAPDKPVGRRAMMTHSPVFGTATESNIPIRTPANLKDDAFFLEFSELRPDLCIVAAYGRLIPARFLAVPRLGFLNIHPSLLPAYRGPSPVRSAILDGRSSTGVSIMLLDEQMDHGPILAQEPWTIPSGFDAPACEAELASLGARLLVDTLSGYADGTIVPMPQDESRATFTRKFTREDGRLDWHLPAETLYNHIRALAAEPGTWTTWRGKTLNILSARMASGRSDTPGSVSHRGDGIAIACQDGFLMVERLQPEGGKTMDAHAFANGHPEFIGSEVE
jgi:methionyl-tRNA formyltransferase